MRKVNIQSIALQLELGQAHAEVEGVRVPLRLWELSPKLTGKERQEVAISRAIEIYQLVKG